MARVSGISVSPAGLVVVMISTRANASRRGFVLGVVAQLVNEICKGEGMFFALGHCLTSADHGVFVEGFIKCHGVHLSDWGE